MIDQIIFIINPISGKKKGKNLEELINNTFTNKDDYKIVYTSFSGEATQIAKKYYNKGARKIIAVGGDGTVNEVASAIADTDAILGIIPIGSGNGLARHLGVPLKLHKALRLIKDGKHTKIDYGKINNQKFFCTAGAGFDAHIGHIFSKMKGRGFTNYIRATVTEFRNYKPQRYEITMNGSTIMRDAFLITFANASQYGNNAHIAPRADLKDGKLEVAIMRSFSLITAPGIGARLFLKNIDKSVYLETYQCDQVVVKRESSDVVHFDGEPGKMDEILNIKLVPEGLNVFVN